MPNPYEESKRLAKLLHLSDLARLEGLTADELAHYSDAQRRDFATRAGVHPPSSITWDALLQSMRSSEEAVRTSVRRNPFDLVPKVVS